MWEHTCATFLTYCVWTAEHLDQNVQNSLSVYLHDMYIYNKLCGHWQTATTIDQSNGTRLVRFILTDVYAHTRASARERAHKQREKGGGGGGGGGGEGEGEEERERERERQRENRQTETERQTDRQRETGSKQKKAMRTTVQTFLLYGYSLPFVFWVTHLISRIGFVMHTA